MFKVSDLAKDVPVPGTIFELIQSGSLSSRAAWLYVVILRSVAHPGGSSILGQNFLCEMTGLESRADLNQYAAELEANRLVSRVPVSQVGKFRVDAHDYKVLPFPKPGYLIDGAANGGGAPTSLYRWFDEAGRLLYVGITEHLTRRQTAHAKRSSWGEFAATSTVERFATRAEAADAEVAAIRAEQPLFNGTHNDTPEARERLVRYLIERDRPDLLAPEISRG